MRTNEESIAYRRNGIVIRSQAVQLLRSQCNWVKAAIGWQPHSSLSHLGLRHRIKRNLFGFLASPQRRMDQSTNEVKLHKLLFRSTTRPSSVWSRWKSSCCSTSTIRPSSVSMLWSVFAQVGYRRSAFIKRRHALESLCAGTCWAPQERFWSLSNAG